MSRCKLLLGPHSSAVEENVCIHSISVFSSAIAGPPKHTAGHLSFSSEKAPHEQPGDTSGVLQLQMPEVFGKIPQSEREDGPRYDSPLHGAAKI